MYKYKTTTCGFPKNYTVCLYKEIKGQDILIKKTDYNTKNINQAYKKFVKENNLKERA
jgi:hypothetical protein